MNLSKSLLAVYGLILSLFVIDSFQQARKRDIVFLIDGSPGMGRSFLQIRNFLTKVIQELDIGPDKNQIAVVQYSSNPRLEFGLNSHSTKNEVLDAIKKLRLKTGRPLNTGAALDYVTRNVFTPSAGGRSEAGASQILVLITAGKSRDDVGQAADAVKQAGIVPIAIGAKSADMSELQQIVSNPDSVLKLGDFQELQTIQQELLSKVRAVFVIEEPIPPTEVTPEAMNKRDIVFLIDESDYIGNSNLPPVRDFIIKIIENLDIGSDRVRVGLVLYSDIAETEFYLNTNSRKDELLTLLRLLRFKGGTTLNTGKALDFVLRHHFTRSAGSRREEGVPQILVLITGGRSGDDIKASAVALKQAAIITFTIGARNADPAQLKEMAFEPSLAFNVRHFYSLSNLQQQVMTSLQRLRVQSVPIEEATVPIDGPLVTSTKVSTSRKRDIIFLIDGSPGMGRSFLQVREFLNKVIQELDIGPDKDQVAVVQYSSNPRLEFGLNSHSTKDEILDAIKKLRLKTGRPLNTGAALDYVTRNVFTPSAGGRGDAGASQILVLITAGKSGDDVGQAADAVKQAGIVPIAIGAKSADMSELQQIVSNPDSVLKLGDFKELQTIQQELLSKVRAVFVIEEPIHLTEVLPKEMSERDIVFLIDGSDNIGNTNLPFVRDFMTRIIQNLAVGSDKVRVGLAQYSDDTEVEFYLNTYSSEAELLSHIRSLRLRGGTTVNTGSALDFAIKYYFTSSAGSRIKENVPQFLVLVTGGRSSDDVEAPADALKRAAVMTFAVAVKHPDPAQLEEIAIDPSLIFNAKEFHSLSDIQNQIMVPLTTLTVPTVIIEEPTIKHEVEPVPPTEALAVKKRDIVFLIDGSPGMGRSFLQVREFLNKMIQELDIGPDKDQVAVVQYSSNPRLEFGLNSHSTKDEVLDAIKKLRLKTGRPLNTGAALDYVTKNVFTPSAGGRGDAGASQILVLITAGKSRDDVGQAAVAVKRAGIEPIAIGAKSADTSELQQIVSNPDSVLKLGDFKELQTIQQELLSKVRAEFVIEEPIPPTEVLPKEMSERDIVFLIDGSDNVGNTNLPFVRDFMTRIIQNLAVGSDKVRVGLAQYSDDTEAEFYLNTYSSEAELLSHIRSLRLRGGTTVNTGSALDFAIKYYFTSSAGSRIKENVPQFLVLVTGGRSSDDVEAPADALKRAAVMTFAVAVKHPDPAQLEEIAIDPSLIFNVKEFHSLSDIQNQMMVPLTTLTVPTVIIEEPTIKHEEEPAPPTKASAVRNRDIVFLIDGSPGMGRSFLQVREFLNKVIQELDIGPDKDQVAVVQYSSSPRLEFGLNSHSTKDEILDAIKKLRLKTGRPLNTGAALDYVTRNVFTPSAGGRSEAGASQILVLITAGKSRDDVGQAADAVKQAGIVPIAIGAKSADMSELQQIVSNPDFVLKLGDFQELQTVQQELLSKVRAEFVIEEPIPPTEVLPKEMSERDIVFLIDGSDNVGNTNLPFVRDFMTRIIQNLAIGSDKVRVGLAQYSDDTEAEFYLNTYSSEAELLSHIRSLRLRGGTTVNTGSALDFAIKYYFTSSAGSRIKENVPQFLVLVTGGRSSDDVEAPADALKRAAVMTFAVGVKHPDPAQLEEIAIDPSLIFNVKEFHSLSDIQNQMMAPLTTLTVPTVIIEEPTIKPEEEPAPPTEAMKRDIVFLIDGSSGMGRSFLQVREFLNRVIQELDIGPVKDQVAVVQYSSNPRLEFGLNSHSTKDEVLDAIKKLRLKTGRPLNTGAALDYVTRNVFTPSAGGRGEAGASQILVLITAGKSRDDVGQAADAVKRAGIVPIAIGAKSADTSELHQIVSNPDSVLKLKDFQEFQTIQQELLSKVRAEFVIEEPIPPTEVVPQEVNRRDIVFLIDGSVYVGNVNFIHIREFIARLIETLDIGSDRVQVAVAQYSDDVKTESYLNSYSTKADLLSHVRGLKVKGGRTVNTGAALNYVLQNHFTKSAGSRKEEGVPQILMLLTGGRSRDDIKSSADALKRAAVMTFSVGARKADPAQLNEISSDPNLVFNVKEFHSLSDVQNQVLALFSTSVMTPLPTTIVPPVTKAEVVPQEVNRRDIVFLIDGSVYVGNVNFIHIREFIARLIETLDIGSDRVQVAVAQYSDDVKTESYLNSYSTKADLLSHVRGLKVKGGRTVNTGAALNYVLQNHFTKSAGSRKEEGVPQILMLLTGGRSRDDIKSSADALKRAAVMTFSVGARKADPAQLNEISSDPSLVFNVKEFRFLSDVQNQVLAPLLVLPALQHATEEPIVTTKEELPIQKQEEINKENTGNSCQTASGEGALPKGVSKRDIVFLIDGSDYVENTDFPFVRDFLTSIIENLDIGSDRVQISLVQYSDYAETEFYLNTYSSEDEILSHVEGLRLRGGMPLNTGAALDYVLRNHFTRSSGSRKEEGVPQILVLITAGRSRDYIKPSVDALNQAAVTTFAVGTRNADPAQLREIASDPSLSLSVQEFHSLPHAQEQVMILISAPPAPQESTDPPTVPINPAEKTSKRDIVFLIDGSDNVGTTDFPFVHDFLTSIIENLDIGSGRVQIGLVQYSNYAETEFYLNTYSSEDEILSHVEGLRLRGGMPLNTGAALDYVLKNHFTRSSGSRKEEGVPQILVLITAGRSRDYIKPSVDALNQAAVTTFAVGTRNADPAQLREIASDPSLSLSVQEFRSLPHAQEQVMILISAPPAPQESTDPPTVPINPVVPDEGSKRDIVFLIDGSDNVGNGNLPFVRDFLTSIIENFDIGSDRVQVGLVQYSNFAETEFYLNTYSSEDEILSHVEGLRLRGGMPLNTGAALDYVLRNHFTRSSGSRKEEGVPQLLVLITAGRSSDDIKPSTDALKQAAVIIFAIGARNADPAQLKEIAIDPSLVFRMQEFHSLPHIQEQVMTPLSTLAASRAPTKKPTVPIKQVVPEVVNMRDIVFLIDGSDHVGDTNFALVRDFLASIIQNLDIGNHRFQVGLVQYSTHADTEFYLNTYLSKADILSHVRRLRLKGGTRLNTGAAMDYVYRYHFISSAGSRKRNGAAQFLVLLTGGRSSDDVNLAAAALKRATIMSFAVGVKNADLAQLKEIAIDPSLVFNTNEYYSLSNIQEEMTALLSTLPAPRAIPEEPTALIKQVSAVRKRDIVFLIDGSPGMGRSFLQVREFLNKVIQELDIGPDKDQVAVVQYSSNPRLEFGLNSHSTKDEVLDAIKKLRLKAGRPLNTGAALDYVTRNVFTPSAGGRGDAGASQILVLITAGKSRDDVGQAADAVKQAGIVPIAIGAKSADMSELQQIVSNPDSVLKLRDFKELQTVQQELLSKVRAVFAIEKATVTTEVLPKEMSERDIVFLIDGSDNVGNTNLSFVRDFMTRIIQNLAIGSDKVRVGLAQYSDDTEAEFYLNTYSSEAELLSHIRSLRLRGGTTVNTGSALDFAIKYYFTSSAGSRIKENVPQFLVLVTGGRSSDDVEAPADALKRAAVMTFAVGVKHPDPAQLEEIAIDPSLIFNVKEFHSLSDIQNQMMVPLTTLTVPTVIIEEPTIKPEEEPVPPTEARKRDIVFLIDGSPGMGRSFPLVREFLNKIIQELDIGPDKDQVAVVQYSSDSRVEFGLNIHSTKDEVLDAIKKLRLKTGRPLNTGAALDYVTRNVFTPSAGSRGEAGASQILVLITAGKSRDDVGQAADAVKQAGIVPIAIGAKSADMLELQQIVYESNFILKLRDFRELPSIQKELISKVKTVFLIEEITAVNTEVLPEEVNKRDIVFLIDGSDNVGNTNLLLVHDFIRNIIENLNIGSDRVRVGLAQFSHNTKTEFYLDTYSSKAEVLSHVKGLKLNGGTMLNTGAALDFVFRNHFTSHAGSRKDQGVPQFLVVFTGGRSMDAVKPYADALKRAAIATFAVGVRNADPAQLREIATDPNLVFSVKEFHNLPNVQERVMTPLSTLSAPTVTTGESIVIAGEPLVTNEKASVARQRDIVFLIDGTLGMGKAFPLVRAFLIRLIQELDIGPDKDQIAVIQYSHDSKTEFGLNTYASKDEVLAATTQLKWKTGRVLNTGAALNYVTRNVFITSAGSRQDTGATQILVLITAGKSRDDVGQAAFAVKQAGIVPIAIGAKNAHSAELQQIVYSPDFVFVLKTFHTIPTIQQQLISILKSVSVESL
ncbi:collagen alpha-1(XII) chain-like isoform X5 [Cetorhinus maximus]